MKKILFICLVSLVATIQGIAQIRDTTFKKVDVDLLLQKAKKQNTTAWILLGGGLGLGIAGLAIIANDVGHDASAVVTTVLTLGYVTPEEHKHSVAGPILALAGTGALIGSVPLFFAADKNKRDAQLVLKTEKVFFNPQLNLNEHLLSIGLKFNL